MGSILQAKCSCGYESEELLLGSGMLDLGNKFEVPYYCDNCCQVESLNLFKWVTTENISAIAEPEVRERITCKSCRRKVQYYGELIKDFTYSIENDDVLAFRWGNVIGGLGEYSLPAKNQYCPKCKNMTLDFYDIGCWD